MKVSFSEYVKKLDASVLVAMAIFKGLNDKYLSKSLAEVSETTSGGTPLRNNPEYYNGNIAWLKSGELNDGFIAKAEETITELGLKNSSAKLFPKGTLLVAMYGATTGRVGILNIPSTTNQAVCAILPKAELDRDYLYWFLRQHRYEFITISKGGAQPNISQTLINRTEIPLPPIQEQKNIAQLLTEIEIKKTVNENLIEKDFQKDVKTFLSIKGNSNQISTELNHQLALVKELRQAYLREAMQGKLVLQDERDEPAEILLEKIKAEKEKLVAEKRIKRDKPLPPFNAKEIPFEIPSNWTWCRFADCSINRDGERVPISLPERERRKKIYDYYGASGVIDKIDNFTHNGRFLLIGEDGANLVARSTPIAFIAEGKFWVNNHAHVVETVNEITTDYLCNYINGISLHLYITGGFQPKLSQGNLNTIITPLPPLAEQERIVAKLEKLMKFCDELEVSIKQGITNADRLLQTALKEALESK